MKKSAIILLLASFSINLTGMMLSTMIRVSKRMSNIVHPLHTYQYSTRAITPVCKSIKLLHANKGYTYISIYKLGNRKIITSQSWACAVDAVNQLKNLNSTLFDILQDPRRVSKNIIENLNTHPTLSKMNIIRSVITSIDLVTQEESGVWLHRENLAKKLGKVEELILRAGKIQYTTIQKSCGYIEKHNFLQEEFCKLKKTLWAINTLQDDCLGGIYLLSPTEGRTQFQNRMEVILEMFGQRESEINRTKKYFTNAFNSNLSPLKAKCLFEKFTNQMTKAKNDFELYKVEQRKMYRA